MEGLRVYLRGEWVGKLAQDENGGMRFQYVESWLKHSQAIPLSRSLPLGDRIYEGRTVRAFFVGLLPEETVRRGVASILGVSVDNEFGILERIGGDCAGAVSVLEDSRSVLSSMSAASRELSVDELGAILQELPRRPLLAGQPDVRLSLAGAQGKLPLVVDSGTYFLPMGRAASSHIIKPEPERFPGLVANEYFCMQLAAKAGLPVPQVGVGEAGGIPYLLVARYDRDRDASGVWTRIHQEDFCQALGLPPERKYEQEGGPAVRDCIKLLREWSTVPVVDILTYLDAVVFNVLIANTDAHGKNYSLLYTGKERRLAPLYDLICTSVWPELSTRLSMKIGGCTEVAEVNSGHWKKLSTELGIAWPGLRQRIRSLHNRLTDNLAHVHEDVSSIHLSMADAIRDRVELQLKRLKV